MTSFLLIISLLLHLIMFIIIFYLYQHLQLIKSEQAKEINELLSNFLHEIKLENKALKQPITHFPNQNKMNVNEDEDIQSNSKTQHKEQLLSNENKLENNQKVKDEL